MYACITQEAGQRVFWALEMRWLDVATVVFVRSDSVYTALQFGHININEIKNAYCVVQSRVENS
jgi:hypothetical protein